jgi:hypothetical protein
MEPRTERIVATLEQHLTKCEAALAACFEDRTPEDLLQEWPLKRMMGLMKLSAQLASTIHRLQKAGPENLEKRGSIPQESCG